MDVALQDNNMNQIAHDAVSEEFEEMVKQQIRNNKKDALNGEALEEYLHNLFNSQMVTVAEFKKFLKISGSFWSLMKKHGNLPRIIPLTPCGNEGRILVHDLARWIERNSAFGCLIKKEYCGMVDHPRNRKQKNQMAEQETASAAI